MIAPDTIINRDRPAGWRFEDGYCDGDAFGVCAVNFYRTKQDRRLWSCVPHGDNARNGGVFPIVTAVMDDFGNLVRVGTWA